MKGVIFLLLFLGFFLLFHEMRALERVAGALKRTREGMEAAARQRRLADRQQLAALEEKHSFWRLLEQQLQYSGIRNRFPQITAEWWIAGNAAAGAFIFVVFGMTGGVKAAAAVLGLFGAAEWYGIKKLRQLNLRRTERNLTKLLDFLGNYSVTSGEITGIFRQISRYLEEPLRSALDICCQQAATTGDTEMALGLMAERVEHPKFKELVRNMEVSIRYCADFTALVDSSRRSLRESLSFSGERRGMVREAMINLILLGGMSVAVLFIVERLTGTDMRRLLTETWPGRLGIGILLLIFLWFRSSLENGD